MQHDIKYWQSRANYHRVVIGEHLSNVRHGMSKGLSNLLLELTAYTERLTQTEVADILNELGIVAADGRTITNSNVSNTMRKSLSVRRVPNYEKDGYKGRNWQWYANAAKNV